ncbi:MAG: bifunctional serine/threonine-protein kinase/formylglycine-generating enzyme family protein, partial [Rhodanobacteraceae bacterium]
MTNLKLPFEIPGYRMVRRLGLGGMATVYLAIQRSLGRPVAVKVLAIDHTHSEELVRRFEHEARTIARLDHPHIVNIFDVGRTSTGQIYYTMPYLPNGDLATRNLREDQPRTLEIMRALADALGYAHEHGIVHRDVKPENVLFDKLDRPMLADFGIALSDMHQPRVTREGATIGSSGYMSPEQARSQPLDGRSDIYSLGVLCYELLTGEMPFRGPDTLSVALAHIENPVPRLPMLRRVWQPFIDKALAKRPEARYQGAEEVLAALDEIEVRLAVPPPRGVAKFWHGGIERLMMIPRRTRALAIGLLITIALAGVIALLPHVPGPAAALPEAHDAAAAPVQAAAVPVAEPVAETPAEVPVEAPTPQEIEIERLLGEAKTLTAKGRIFAPKTNNAVERYLAVLRLDARQKDALAGIEGLFTQLAKEFSSAIAASNITQASETIERAIALNEQAKLKKSKAFPAFRDSVHEQIEKVRKVERAPFDTKTLAPYTELLPALAKIDAEEAGALKADIERPVNLLSKGGTFRDRSGPELAVIPAQDGDAGAKPFSLGVTDVTRGAYERFAAATKRPAAKCRDSRRLFARSKDLGWRAPGFTQSDDHPVVCVSWNDAKAYVDWLSQQTSHRYRLPTQREWLIAARAAGVPSSCSAGNFGEDRCSDGYAYTAPVARYSATGYGLFDVAGNVDVWTADCAKGGSDGSCERVIRGLSWR